MAMSANKSRSISFAGSNHSDDLESIVTANPSKVKRPEKFKHFSHSSHSGGYRVYVRERVQVYKVGEA
jgi:hypothetical protein